MIRFVPTCWADTPPSTLTPRTVHRSPLRTQSFAVKTRRRSLRRVVIKSPALALDPVRKVTSRPIGVPWAARRSVRARSFSAVTICLVGASITVSNPAAVSAAHPA